MDGSAFSKMDLGGLFRWLFAFAIVGAIAIFFGTLIAVWWLVSHLAWV